MKSWCIGKASADYVANMEDVLAVYQQVYNPQRPVVCLDEIAKSLHSTPRGDIPMAPGRSRREDYQYQRHGTCALFLAVEPLIGKRYVWVRERRTKRDFAEVVRDLVDNIYPDAEQIILVMDNLNTHKPGSLYARFAADVARRITTRIEWHYTPKHGSWLNIAECELSVLKRQCLKARMPDIMTVSRQVAAWQKSRNDNLVSIDWRFTTAEARIKLKRLYPIVNVQDSV